MSVENQEERTVEVLGVPDGVDEELLSLYFENKRRSGGGPLVSVEKARGCIVLVFEEPEAAAGVLLKRPHVVHNVELMLRRPATKDKHHLLLRGVSTNTCQDLVELYVENILELDIDDYKLYRSPGKDLILIHLTKPLAKDFQSISAKISKKPLDGATMTLEQVEQTDSILVENLHPGMTTDMLTLYFESKRGGACEVKDVIMMSENSARVIFVDYQAVDKVLKLSHKLDDSEVVVRPYFPALQPAESLAPQPSGNVSNEGVTPQPSGNVSREHITAQTSGNVSREHIAAQTSGNVSREHIAAQTSGNVSREHIAPQTSGNVSREHIAPQTSGSVSRESIAPSTTGNVSRESIAPYSSRNGPRDKDTEGTLQNLTTGRMQSSPPVTAGASVQPPPPQKDLGAAAPPAAMVQSGEVPMDLTEYKELLKGHVDVPDPVKLALLQRSTFLKDIKGTHPGFDIQIKEDGVSIAGPDKLGMEQLKNAILEFQGKISQAHLTFDLHKARFLANKEVKERLLQTMNAQGLPTMYTVLESVVVLMSVSLDSVDKACSLLKSQICDFSIPVGKEYESMLYSDEWSAFVQSLELCSIRISEKDGSIEGLTLKGMEDDKQATVLEFLTTPIEKEIVISMLPSKLKYLQMHQHQLLADMDQVSILPIEEDDVCGLRLQGSAGACQMAHEILQDVVSSVLTRTITLNEPGVARFMIEGEGSRLVQEMERKFLVYIDLTKVHWTPLPHQDLFKAAWNQMSHRNFQRVCLDGSAHDVPAFLLQANQNSKPTQKPDSGLLEEAKKIFSSIGENMETDHPSSSSEDLYTAGEAVQDSQPRQASGVGNEESSPASLEPEGMGAPLQDTASGPLPCDLEEEAQLSLAIQYSMESTKRSMVDEDEELQRVLELSKKMVRYDQNSDLKKAINMSLKEVTEAANTAEVFVCASHTCDLIRSDIALSKKVTSRHAEEKLDNKILKNLSEFSQSYVQLIKRKYAVEIHIQGTRATISGLREYVDEALPSFKQMLKEIANTSSDTEILRSVHWVWRDPASSATVPYAPDTVVFIENAWKMKQKKIHILLDNQPHIIDFEKMEEYNVASKKSVKISRKMLSSEDLYTGQVAAEEYSLLANLPEATKVDEASDEFQDVVKDFYDSLGQYHNKIKLVKVEKLMNQLLYNQYKLKKVSISQSATDPVVERTLYHGTSESSVKEICLHGFNRSFCGKNATVYGQGVYFAVKSSLSASDTYSPPNANGYKFVFVAKVLTGDFTNGCHSMKTAPLKETSDVPLRYDSVTDNISDPTLFVIFNDTQAYPEYIITCQKMH